MNRKLFDHTILNATATKAQVLTCCREAIDYGFASVCVNGCYTALTAKTLAGTDVLTCTVVGFPLGQMSAEAKIAETRLAIADGADEIDMVINIPALKEHRDDELLAEIQGIKQACGTKTLKVILETCELTDEEIVRACRLTAAAHGDFVKTSTGFGTGGATPEHVALMRKTVGDALGVKASGGIRDRKTAEKMVAAGANRLGTSATIKIVEEPAD